MLDFAIVFTFVLLIFLSLYGVLRLRTRIKNSICILVLGDIGRSPRMQYHALSFSKLGFAVNIIGYPGSAPLKRISNSPHVKIDYLISPPDLQNKITRLVSYAVKVIWQSVNLCYVLFYKCRSSHLILQNPPAIPTIPICWFYCFVSNTKFAIDWHNYAYSIMAMNLGRTHFLVKIAKFIEFYFGSKADYNFCVTESMQTDLEDNYGIVAKPFHDRPAERFRPITIEEKHALFLLLSEHLELFKGENDSCTLFTETLPNGEIKMRSDRPGLLVSSTSWTEDEDFAILLNALEDYEAACMENNLKLPKLICVITGKGPLKDFYTAIIRRKNWKNVTVITPWLKNEDYPKILGSADVGVCLHTSSSGLDLPMKIVDMFGCGLPVLAYDFESLRELVQHEENGLIFSHEKELFQQLTMWFENFPNVEYQAKCNKYQKQLENFRLIGWHANWAITVLPCFKFRR